MTSAPCITWHACALALQIMGSSSLYRGLPACWWLTCMSPQSAEDFLHCLQRIASAPAEQQAADSAAAEEAEKVVTPLRALW